MVTLSPVVKISSVRFFLAMIAIHHLSLNQLDIKMCFYMENLRWKFIWINFQVLLFQEIIDLFVGSAVLFMGWNSSYVIGLVLLTSPWHSLVWLDLKQITIFSSFIPPPVGTSFLWPILMSLLSLEKIHRLSSVSKLIFFKLYKRIGPLRYFLFIEISQS